MPGNSSSPSLRKEAVLIFPVVRFLEQGKDATSYEQTIDIAGHIKHDHRMLQNYLKGVTRKSVGILQISICILFPVCIRRYPF